MVDKKKLILEFWRDVASQNGEKLRTYFSSNALINWYNTNEQFSAHEYIIANCEYPGAWCGQVERIEIVSSDLVITVARVWAADGDFSCHAVSFFHFQDDKIARLDEYWGDDGDVPEWRLKKEIGRPIASREVAQI